MPNLTASALMKSPYCPAVIFPGSSACAANFSRTSGRESDFPISPFSRATISRGVPAGAITPKNPIISNPGRPDSAIVGTLATTGERFKPVWASIRSLPACTNPIDAVMFENIIGRWPAMTSMSAGPSPLNGTCTSLSRAWVASSSPDMCGVVPSPPEA